MPILRGKDLTTDNQRVANRHLETAAFARPNFQDHRHQETTR